MITHLMTSTGPACRTEEFGSLTHVLKSVTCRGCQDSPAARGAVIRTADPEEREELSSPSGAAEVTRRLREIFGR